MMCASDPKDLMAKDADRPQAKISCSYCRTIIDLSATGFSLDGNDVGQYSYPVVVYGPCNHRVKEQEKLHGPQRVRCYPLRCLICRDLEG